MERPTSPSSLKLETSPELKRQNSPKKLLKVGPYQFYEEDPSCTLGEGKFGVVFRAENTKTGESVALKRVPQSHFRREEIECVRQLVNPNIIGYFDTVTIDEWTYIPMELCDFDLSSFLENYKRLTNENLDYVGRSLADGTLAIHKMDIVHRDIKPQNLLVKLRKQSLVSSTRRRVSLSIARKISLSRQSSPDALEAVVHQPRIANLKITDFGCSRKVRGTEAASNLVGTFIYMAPEVGANLLDDNSYTSSVDIWSSGVVLYEAMIGALPFEEQALYKLFLRATDRNYSGFTPPPLREIDGPKKYRDVIEKLIQIDPAERLTSQEFHDATVLNRNMAEIDESKKSKKRQSEKKNGGKNGLQKNISGLFHGDESTERNLLFGENRKSDGESKENARKKGAKLGDNRSSVARFLDKMFYYCFCCCCVKHVG